MLHWPNAALLPAQLITVSCCHVRTTSDGRKTEVLGLRRPRAGQAALHTGSRTETTDAHYFTIHGPVSVARDTKKKKKSSSGSMTAAMSGISGGPCSIGFAKLGLVLRGGTNQTNGCDFKVLIPLIA